MLKEILGRAVIVVLVYYVLGYVLQLTVYPAFKPELAFAISLGLGNMLITFIRLKYFPNQKRVVDEH